MKKKFSLFLVFMLALLTWIGGINPQEARAKVIDYEIGTKNLNNTPQNSAKVGVALKNPEIGWKRYNDSNSKLVYTGEWKVRTLPDYYKSHVSYSNIIGNNIRFKFFGSKIRIIADANVEKPKVVNITIDKNNYSYSQESINAMYTRLSFEKIDLDLGVHEVTITVAESSGNTALEAIDIDETGYLIDPLTILAESISLDKTSLTLLEGTSEKLTATVLPEDATNKKVIWSSSDPSVAVVDENGNVIAIKEGQAVITATTTDSINLTATCNVTVTKPVTNWANLEITMTNGQIKKYNLPMVEVDKFINWYIQRVAGAGKPFYGFVKTTDIAPFINKTEYIIFDKISSFEINEYKVQQ